MKLYSLTQVAKILGKSKQWLWVLIQSGRLKAEKVGTVYIIEEQSLKAYQTTIDQSNPNITLT
jgi:excisionase family DNA binding protein